MSTQAQMLGIDAMHVALDGISHKQRQELIDYTIKRYSKLSPVVKNHLAFMMWKHEAGLYRSNDYSDWFPKTWTTA